MPHVFRYTLNDSVEPAEVESNLALALNAVEGLHGTARTRLEAGYALDENKRVLVIDAATRVGQHLNRVFVNFLVQQYGPDAFVVARVPKTDSRTVQPSKPSMN